MTILNPLLRYRVIDKCLKNPQLNCTIDLLIQRCSDALSESFGELKSVSERTIRNDIRILRSDVLGFNAPIIFENGRYFYDDDDYVLFAESNFYIKSIIDLQEYLVNYNFEMNINLNYLLLLKTLSNITGIALPSKIISSLSKIENNMISKNNIDHLEELNLTLEHLKSKSNWYKEMTKLIEGFSDNLK